MLRLLFLLTIAACLSGGARAQGLQKLLEAQKAERPDKSPNRPPRSRRMGLLKGLLSFRRERRNSIRRGHHRYDFLVGVAYGTSTDLVMRTLTEAIAAQPEVLKEPAATVAFEAFGDNALTFTSISGLIWGDRMP